MSKQSKSTKRARLIRDTCRLEDYRIPRDWFRHDIVLTNEWSTPEVVMPTYRLGQMTDSGSRCCPKSGTTSSWLLPSQTMIQAVNGDALAWNHLLHFVRTSLLSLIPVILEAQRDWLAGAFKTGKIAENEVLLCETRLVLRAYAHNVRAAIDHYADAIADDSLIWSHSMSCGSLLALDDFSPTSSCPQQVWLRRRLCDGGPPEYVKNQIKIWESADPWALLPLAKQLPECGPDMADLGSAAWDALWLPRIA